MHVARTTTVKSLGYTLILLLCAISLRTAKHGRADAQNGQLIPLGERQAYLANTGNSPNTGAVYFNPGSLDFLECDKVSVTGSVYRSYATEAAAAFDLPDSRRLSVQPIRSPR